jgi:hypothetical protein
VVITVHAPGIMYLRKVDQVLPDGPECEHKTDGQWLVSWSGQLYSIQPANNLQMGIWLDSAKREVGNEEARKALRWLCWTCGTVQKIES